MMIAVGVRFAEHGCFNRYLMRGRSGWPGDVSGFEAERERLEPSVRFPGTMLNISLRGLKRSCGSADQLIKEQQSGS